jgi:hypothetical protein
MPHAPRGQAAASICAHPRADSRSAGQDTLRLWNPKIHFHAQDPANAPYAPDTPSSPELKKHKPCFEEGCSKLFDQKKNKPNCSGYRIQEKKNGDNLNTIRRETSRHFRNKKREYTKNKIDELTTNSKIKNRDLYRGINDFERGYQPRSNLVKAENGDLLADPHNFLNRWKN